MKAVTIFICVLLSLTFAGAVVRNNFVHHARSLALRDSSDSSSSSLVFSIDNSTAVAQGTIQCQNTSQGEIVNVTIVVDAQYILTKFAIYINRAGAPQYITVDQYGYVENNATNGYSYSQCGLYQNVYHFAVNYSTLINITSSGCFSFDIAVDLKKFCGSYTSIEAISQSVPGCDTEFQVLSPAPNSYVQILISPNQTLDGYCVNPGLDIGANTHYQAQILSSYDPRVLNSNPGEYVQDPQNLDLVNYLFNNQNRYYAGFANVTGAEVCHWQDIQISIWTLLDSEGLNHTHNTVRGVSQACVDNIVADARRNGDGYIPPCPGGKYIVLVVPIDRDCKTNCTRLAGVQITAFIQGGPCLTECNLTYCHYPQIRASGNFSCSGACNPSPSSSPVYPCVPRPSNSPVNYPCIPRPESASPAGPSPSNSQAPVYPCIPRPEPVQ